jgi:hypothetical protein
VSALRDIALAPVWAAQLVTAAKSFEDNRILGSARLNDWGLHAARVRLAHRLTARRRRRLGARIDPAHRAAIDRDGFVALEGLLPGDDFERLVDQVRAYRSRGREKIEGDTLMRKIDLGRPARDAVPALAALFDRSPWRPLLDFVAGHTGTPVVYLQSLFRNVGVGDRDPQSLIHSDTFHPTVKAWFYLTDVDLDAGPLLYVPGSHRLSEVRLRWEQRMSRRAVESHDPDTRQGSFRIDEAGLAELGLGPPRPLVVGANTLVVADTHGFHARGPAADGGRRVEIWAIGGRSPFLASQRVDRWLDRLDKPRRPDEWRPREPIGAFDPP